MKEGCDWQKKKQTNGGAANYELRITNYEFQITKAPTNGRNLKEQHRWHLANYFLYALHRSYTRFLPMPALSATEVVGMT